MPVALLMSQGKTIKERVYWHCLCGLLALAKWWPPVDGKTLRRPQINRFWKYFVNHWQSFPRSEHTVSGSLSVEPENYFLYSMKLLPPLEKAPGSTQLQRGAGYQLDVRLKSVPKLVIVLAPWILLCMGMSFWLK